LIVVDASVAVKWLLANEELEREAAALLATTVAERDAIIAPTLLPRPGGGHLPR